MKTPIMVGILAGSLMANLFVGTGNWAFAQSVGLAALGFAVVWTRQHSVVRSVGAAAICSAISLVVTQLFAGYLPH
jgi:hypothetical protein